MASRTRTFTVQLQRSGSDTALGLSLEHVQAPQAGMTVSTFTGRAPVSAPGSTAAAPAFAVRVRAVAPNSVAARTKALDGDEIVRAGDKVVAVNGLRTAELGLTALKRELQLPLVVLSLARMAARTPTGGTYVVPLAASAAPSAGRIVPCVCDMYIASCRCAMHPATLKYAFSR